MTVLDAFGELAETLAQMDPEKIVNLRASAGMSERVEELVQKKKAGDISSDESIELERYLSLDLFINLAKARAKLLLAA